MQTIGVIPRSAATVNGEWLMAMAQSSANASNTVNALCEDSAAMTLIFNNPTLMATIGNSGTVFTAISDSTNSVTIGKWIAFKAGLNPADYADMTAVIASSTAMTAVAASSTAMTAVAASSTAMTAVIASSTAMTAVAASSTAMTAVAASSTAMTAVIASSTAMTAVAASSTAMTAVIASSTAMTAVIASSTACAAIKASATAITALDNSSPITVPTMTSNTTPSGIVSSDSVYSDTYAGWCTFDNNGTSRWSANNSNAWIKYQFTSPRWCYKIALINSVSAIKNFIIQYSSNGINWSNALTTIAVDSSAEQVFNVCVASEKVAHWRLLGVDTWGAPYSSLIKLQFYCK